MAQERPQKPRAVPAKGVSTRELIEKRNYAKAIELLRAELQKRRGDDRLRVQLADVLVLAGRSREAVDILNSLADDMALTGQAGKAIAALKKIEKLEPGREDVSEKLSYLIKHQVRPAEDPWSRARRVIEAPAPIYEPPKPQVPEFGMEEIAEPAAEAATAQATPTAEATLADEGLGALFAGAEERDQLVSMIEEVFTPAAGPSESLRGETKLVESPLFQDFSQEELAEVIRGLRLHTFEPGEIVVSAGEPGSSMFLLTTGGVRAYMRDKRGHHVQVREMGEGDFFGEISILTGNPRSATITAASYCELLELDSATLNAIADTHPRVREVLQEFYRKRATHSIEAAVEQTRG